MCRLPQISEAEFEVMKVIWEKYPISTNEIVDILLKKSTWNVRTIQTLLSRLKKKNAVSYEKEGRMFVYSPLVEKNAYIKHESNSFLKKFYNGAINKMVLNFIENDMISQNDIEELKNILNDKSDN